MCSEYSLKTYKQLKDAQTVLTYIYILNSLMSVIFSSNFLNENTLSSKKIFKGIIRTSITEKQFK